MIVKPIKVCIAIGNLVTAVCCMAIFSIPVLAQAPPASEKPEAPRAGDVAPEFTLSMLDGDEDETVTLSDFAGKQDVVLIFGSYT